MWKAILAMAAAAAMAGSTISASAQTRSEARPGVVRAAVQARGMRADRYAMKAAMSDMFEVESSKLALQRTENPDVKAFAQRMIHDHTQSTQKLQGLLQSTSIDVTPPTSLDRAHQRMLDQLRNASAAQFDRLFMEMQVKGHQDALKLQQGYGRRGQNGELRTFAGNAAPMVQDHLTQARQILRDIDSHPAG